VDRLDQLLSSAQLAKVANDQPAKVRESNDNNNIINNNKEEAVVNSRISHSVAAETTANGKESWDSVKVQKFDRNYFWYLIALKKKLAKHIKSILL
jgi:hypothetical protein